MNSAICAASVGDIERYEAARSCMKALITVLAGDGIGGEVTAEAVRVLERGGGAFRACL